MKRITMTFIVLAVTGGCMAVDPDPINDYPSYGSPQRSPAQSQSWPMSRQPGWGGAEGKPTQTASADWGSRPSTPSTAAPRSWGNSPQSTTVANKSSSGSGSSSTAMAAKPSSARPAGAKTDKSDDTLVKATYTETKAASDKTTSLSATTKPAMAKTSAEATARPDDSKSPPVNLGMLRLLNSKRITFHYEVKDPASTGVTDLEIWGTTDMRNWKKYDATTRSPSSLVVDVKDEGLYGFAMIARSRGEGTKNQPPPRGEVPQMWVAVDLTKPVVQVLGAEMNVMERTPALVVRWNAKDRNLGPRPITLLYAERLDGPWSPIAANMENTGHYEWAMPPCVPANVCVRVQATDLMGNVGMAQTATLHIPGRFSTSAVRMEPVLAEPPSLGNTLLPPYETNIRPLAATAPKPAASIVSVNGE